YVQAAPGSVVAAGILPLANSFAGQSGCLSGLQAGLTGVCRYLPLLRPDVFHGVGQSVRVDCPFLRGVEDGSAQTGCWIWRRPIRRNPATAIPVHGGDQSPL